MARLEPRLRFYKLVYKHEDDKNPEEKEIIFSSHNDSKTVEEMLSNKWARPDGVGIKRFTYTNLGSSDADVNIKCNLELYFRNLEDLDSVYNADFKRKKYASFMDLLIFGPARMKSNLNPYNHGALEWNPDYYELKVSLGWVAPSGADEEMLGPGLKQLIQNTGVNLRLNLLQHAFNFKEDGSGTLNIEFLGWAETHEKSIKSDILTMTKPMLRRMKDLEKAKSRALRKVKEVKRDLDEAESRINQSDRSFAAATVDNLELAKDWVDYKLHALGGDDSYVPETYKMRHQLAQDHLERQEKHLADFDQAMGVARYERLLTRITKTNRLFYIDVSRQHIGNLQNRQLSRKKMAMQRAFGYMDIKEKKKQKMSYKDKTRAAAMTSNTFDPKTIRRQTSGYWEKVAKDSLGKSAKSNDEYIEEDDLIDFSEPKGEDKLRVTFMFLGDLMWHAMDMALLSHDKKKANIRYLLGSMTIIDHATKQPYLVNIADIPISLNLFMVWFMHRVVKPKKDSYHLKDFIRDVVNDLILNALGSGCSTEYPQRPRFNLLRVEAAGYGVGGKKDRVSKTPTGRIKNIVSGIRQAPDIDLSSRRTSKLFFYNYIYIHSAMPGMMRGDPAKDAENGIYHFYVGSDRGLLRGITFDKVDQPGVREARTTMEGVGAVAAQLRHQYNVKITCVGNSLFKPGMYVFVNPRVSGGRANARRSLTFKLGLGGYVFITKVENIIEAGKFTTILYGINDGLLPPHSRSKEGQAPSTRTPKSLTTARACDDKVEHIRKLWIQGSDDTSSLEVF
jgi:hypothetical protein